jgi:hypothetical protein
MKYSIATAAILALAACSNRDKPPAVEPVVPTVPAYEAGMSCGNNVVDRILEIRADVPDYLFDRFLSSCKTLCAEYTGQDVSVCYETAAEQVRTRLN